MFKSSEKLRHEAAQRSLDRVASSWRSARTTWFDGTPASIEARLAETNRVLAVARSGYTPAHLGLTVEAENARKELLAAKHRLLTDFLDDGARAFQGSQRVALDYPDHPGVPLNQLPLPGMGPYGDPVAVAFDAHGEPMDQAGNWESAQNMAQEGYNVQATGDDIGTRHDGTQWTRMPQDKIQDMADYEKGLRKDIGFPMVEREHLSSFHTARQPQENENWEDGANYAEYNGNCTKCGSDNIDHAYHPHSGEYDCSDCGATFHPKVRKLKSNRTAAGAGPTGGDIWHDQANEDDHYQNGGNEGLDNLSRYLGDRLLNPQQYVRTYRDEDGPGLPGGLPMELRKHLNHPDPVQGAYNAGWDASGGTGQHAQYLDHEDPLDAASTDWYRAGGQNGDAFQDGWLDYASEIPHRYNNAADHAGHPEGYFGKDASLHTAGYEDDIDGGWDRYNDERLAPKSIGGEVTPEGYPVHTFNSTGQAYNECMSNDNIKDGDILHIPSEKVVGMAGTWPAAVTPNVGELHAHLDETHANPTRLDDPDMAQLGWNSDGFMAAKRYAEEHGYPTGPHEGE